MMFPVQIEREILIAAPPKYVRTHFATCPFLSALRFRPEGVDTRVVISASLTPDDLGHFIEHQLIVAVCNLRDQLESNQVV